MKVRERPPLNVKLGKICSSCSNGPDPAQKASWPKKFVLETLTDVRSRTAPGRPKLVKDILPSTCVSPALVMKPVRARKSG